MLVVRRLAVILFAFVASAATVIPVFLLLIAVFEGGLPMIGSDILAYSVVAFVMLVVITFFPMVLVVALAEWKRITHWMFFAVAGGLTAMLLLFLLRFVRGLHEGGPNAMISAFLIIGGLAAGLVYWSIAGKTSGALRDAWRTRKAQE